MLRAVLDSNALDPIAKIRGAYEAIERAINDGQVELLITHVTIDELAEVPDTDLRARLLLFAMALTRLVPTGAFVLDVSRLDFARLYDDTEVFQALRSGNIEHSRDALIAVTAQYEHCALVTNDKRMAGRARERGLTVLTSADLFAMIGFVPTNDNGAPGSMRTAARPSPVPSGVRGANSKPILQ
jgi:rRNA-processing protein FCF1